ncbi:MAG: BON domain-containing protein [Planctomycetaceae bacterium]
MKTTVAVLALVAVIAGASPVEAQRSGGTTSGSGTGSTTGSGTASTTGSGTGTTSGGAGGSTGGTATGGGGRQGGGLSGQGVQQPQFQAFGTNQNQNASGFIGRGTGDTFVGQQQAAQQNARGGFGTQFGGLGAQLGGNQGAGTTARGTGQTTTRSRAERLRPQHRVAFSFAPANASIVTTRLQTQIRPLQAGGRLGDVVFSFDGDGTVMLQGTAASIDDRELAAALARLEPGVRRVDNQIVVPQAIPAPAASPAGPP